MRRHARLPEQRLTTDPSTDIPERIALLATLTGDAVVVRFHVDSGWAVNGWPSVWSLAEAFDLAIRDAMQATVDEGSDR